MNNKISIFINDTEVLYDDSQDEIIETFGLDNDKLATILSNAAMESETFTDAVKYMIEHGQFAAIFATCACYMARVQRESMEDGE